MLQFRLPASICMVRPHAFVCWLALEIQIWLAGQLTSFDRKATSVSAKAIVQGLTYQR
jgi:hypothetical protein